MSLYIFESQTPMSLSGKYKGKDMSVQFSRPQNPYEKSVFITSDPDEILFLKEYPTFKKDFVLAKVKNNDQKEISKAEEIKAALEGEPDNEDDSSDLSIDPDIQGELPYITTPDAMKEKSALTDFSQETEVSNITDIQTAKQYLIANFPEIEANKALLTNKKKVLEAASKVHVRFVDLA